jgi:hypothetical protein
MINWTEADNRMNAHFTTTDRVNRQGWRQVADRSGDRPASQANTTLSHRTSPAVHRLSGLCRAAGKLLAVPLHRGAQPS